jgi:S1-C subfamily serine protease
MTCNSDRTQSVRASRFNSSRAVATGLAAIAVFAAAATAHTGELRTWSSASGTYKAEAELIELKSDGTVVLKKKDGTVIQVPLSKLSAVDQQYLRSKSATIPQSDSNSTTTSAGSAEPPKRPEEVENEALQCRTTKEAVLVYTFYLSKPNLSPQQRAAAQASLEAWKKKAADGLVRLGKDWMKEKEAEAIRTKADEKIENAMELLRLGNGDLSRRSLEEASQLDPDSIKADFMMGVVYGLIADNDKKAQLHFERCLKRDPGNVSVLNNLAVSLVFQKKYGPAVQHWKTAAASAPKMRGLAQNIGSLIAMAGAGQARLPDKTMQELAQIYDDLINKHGNPRPAAVGFVYLPPYGSGWEADDGRPRSGGRKESVVVSSGSGFVVHPHVILTNRHVVEGASGLLVLDPKNSKAEPIAAELIAISDELDLALVRCNGLDAPPVRIVEKLPPRGSDIMVLGYPLGPSFGTTLKSTRGSMVAMPDPTLDNMCLYDAITNPGNSGGPLCDKTGRVAAVVRAVTGHVGGSYGAAIPVANAVPFVRQHVPTFAVSTAVADELDWPAVDALVAPSTVLILTKEDLHTDTGVGEGKR